jgi:hypothetical protein
MHDMHGRSRSTDCWKKYHPSCAVSLDDRLLSVSFSIPKKRHTMMKLDSQDSSTKWSSISKTIEAQSFV